jgi:hypothetical protein
MVALFARPISGAPVPPVHTTPDGQRGAGRRALTAARRVPRIAAPGRRPLQRECTYDLYVATFKESRAAVKAGDEARLAAIRARAAKRDGAAATVMLLALEDAQAKASCRTKFEVCRPMCDTRCERGV